MQALFLNFLESRATPGVFATRQTVQSTSQRRSSLPPMSANPHVTVSPMDPVAAYPQCPRMRRKDPTATDPNPAPLPCPVTRYPDVTWPRRLHDDFDLNWRWRLRDNDLTRRPTSNRRALNVNRPFHAAREQQKAPDYQQPHGQE